MAPSATSGLNGSFQDMLAAAGVDVDGLNLDDIDKSLYTPISGLDAAASTLQRLGEDGVDDMIQLDNLDEPTIMKNLELRYKKDIIYTYIGSILVAVNSFKLIKGLYDNPSRFRKKALSEEPPHIFALAEKAYSALISSGVNQSFVISGESGAGKTESMKLICRYMAHLEGEEQSPVQYGVLSVNVVLEAFGNAKTVYNNNSSRFGKFTELQFDPTGTLAGARVREYLLEKSRVVRQAPRERNYHVFYYLVKGADPEERTRCFLQNKRCEDFYYLNQSGCTSIENWHDDKCFVELKNAMSMFSAVERNSIFRLVAGVLHLGNINFDVDANGDYVTGVSAASQHALDAAATIFGVQPEVLAGPLISRFAFIRGESINSPMDRGKAIDSRDALAKAIYGRMFLYIIKLVNSAICLPKGGERFIGILDIFGFENFEKNSFEQLCINYANEQLQDFFNEYIFKLEQLEYKHEGVKINEIQFVDNKPCLDMIAEKGAGLLEILDEQSYFPKATTQSLLSKAMGNFKGHPNYECERLPSRDAFGIRHYAGLVIYDASQFLEKNRDTMPLDLLEVFNTSVFELIRELFDTPDAKRPSHNETNTARRRMPTVGSSFKSSLEELMTVLRKTQPYFVRCVKPNQEQVPNHFLTDFVQKQLKYSGMLETVRIRRQGYPVRYTYEDFVNRFVLMVEPEQRKLIEKRDPRPACADLVKAIQLPATDFQYGRTKIFLRDKPAALLETRLAQIQALRLAKLKAEIERKRKEEEERRAEEEARLEAERLAKEAEEKALAAEMVRAAQEAEARRLEAAKNAPPEPPPPPPEPEEDREPVAPPPAIVALETGQPASHNPDEAPEPIPKNAPSREEIYERLNNNPSWQEERQLRKLLDLYKRHDAYQQKLAEQEAAKRAAEEELTKLPPWRLEIMRRRAGEINQARGRSEPDEQAGRGSAAAAVQEEPPVDLSKVAENLAKGKLARVDRRDSGAAAGGARGGDMEVRGRGAAAQPTMTRAEIEAKLAAKPDWLVEKELKRQLDLIIKQEQEEERKRQEEERRKAEAAAAEPMPPWKREMMERKAQAAAAAAAKEAEPPPPPPEPPKPRWGGGPARGPPGVRPGAIPSPSPGPARPGLSPGRPSPSPAPAAAATPPPPQPASSAAAGGARRPGAAPAAAAAPAAPVKAGQQDNVPAWKRGLDERRRQQAEEKARAEAEAEAARLAKIPAWKRALIEKGAIAPP